MEAVACALARWTRRVAAVARWTRADAAGGGDDDDGAARAQHLVNLCEEEWAHPPDEVACVPLFPNLTRVDGADPGAVGAVRALCPKELAEERVFSVEGVYEALAAGERAGAGEGARAPGGPHAPRARKRRRQNPPHEIVVRLNAFLNELANERVQLLNTDGTPAAEVRLLPGSSLRVRVRA